ncbi:MAG: hypothetical protein HRT72_03410 [Flavobacteriales bacterium]|nr:hypothetical protein [Flavobacteriales bacterium]
MLYSHQWTLFRLTIEGELCLNSGEVIEIDNINSVWIHECGAGSTLVPFFEITLNIKPKSIKDRKRKSLVMTPRYNIRNFYTTSGSDFIDELINLGVKKNVVKGSTWRLFSRPKFKE